MVIQTQSLALRKSYKACWEDGSTTHVVSIAVVESGHRKAGASFRYWRWERRMRKGLLEKMTLKLRFTLAHFRVVV